MNNCIHNKYIIPSPWLTPPEAAKYCKLSLSQFNQKRHIVPIRNIGGTERRPRFHTDSLNIWMTDLYEFETKRQNLFATTANHERIDQYPLHKENKNHVPRLLE